MLDQFCVHCGDEMGVEDDACSGCYFIMRHRAEAAECEVARLKAELEEQSARRGDLVLATQRLLARLSEAQQQVEELAHDVRTVMFISAVTEAAAYYPAWSPAERESWDRIMTSCAQEPKP